ncbi:MAG: L-histidine N(alpha)-methyltransferase [Planctomycetota bacterium]|jgi:dimethylhistidine N-methyltransferase
MKTAPGGIVQIVRDMSPEDRHDEFARDVLSGLSAGEKSLPCKYIYDARGSELFTRIIELPDYYLTRCEAEILRRKGGEILGRLPSSPFDLVELGAGDGRKTRLLLQALDEEKREYRYISIDISRSASEGLHRNLRTDFPGLDSLALLGHYFHGLKWLMELDENPTAVLFLGSNIGNFDSGQTDEFLKELRASLNPGDRALIGFDLKKDPSIIERAYNDAEGISEAFNKNLLARINSELAGSFDPSRFEYRSRFDETAGAVLTHLVSLEEQTVRIDALERDFEFEAGETIHTESSYKYTRALIEELAVTHGFEVLDIFTDEKGFFADAVWAVPR